MKRRKFITTTGIGEVTAGGLAYLVNDNYQIDKYEQRVANI